MSRYLKNLDLAFISKVVAYNPETGEFTRIDTGRSAGCITRLGYRRIGVASGYVMAHRLAFAFVYGWVPRLVDHINGNKLDNRISNLRPADKTINSQNIYTPNKNNKLGVRGVSWAPRQRKYVARIRVNRRLIQIGYFAAIEDARDAYLKAKASMHAGGAGGHYVA